MSRAESCAGGGAMRIVTQCRMRGAGIDGRTLGSLARRAATEALRTGGAADDAEVSVLFVGDERMRELNARYRGVDRATDVLAFAMREASAPGPTDGVSDAERLLGDVVVSLETARRQASSRGHSMRREIAVLLVHGTLHLLGYDHPGGRSGGAAARRMRLAEAECLARLEEKLIV